MNSEFTIHSLNCKKIPKSPIQWSTPVINPFNRGDEYGKSTLSIKNKMPFLGNPPGTLIEFQTIPLNHPPLIEPWPTWKRIAIDYNLPSFNVRRLQRTYIRHQEILTLNT